MTKAENNLGANAPITPDEYRRMVLDYAESPGDGYPCTLRDQIGFTIWGRSLGRLERNAPISDQSIRNAYNWGIREAIQLMTLDLMRDYGFVPDWLPVAGDGPSINGWLTDARKRFREWLDEAASRPETRRVIERITGFFWKDPGPQIDQIRRAIAAYRHEDFDNVEKQEVTGAICADQNLEYIFVTADGRQRLDEKKIRSGIRKAEDKTIDGRIKGLKPETVEKLIQSICSSEAASPAEEVEMTIDAESIRRSRELNHLDLLAALGERLTARQSKVVENLLGLGFHPADWPTFDAYESLKARKGYDRTFDSYCKMIQRINARLDAG